MSKMIAGLHTVCKYYVQDNRHTVCKFVKVVRERLELCQYDNAIWVNAKAILTFL